MGGGASRHPRSVAITAPLPSAPQAPKPQPATIQPVDKRPPGRVVHCSASDVQCPWEGVERDAHDHESACAFVQLRPVLSALNARAVKMEKELAALRGREAGAAAQAHAEVLADMAVGAFPIECQARRDLRDISLVDADLRGIVMTRRDLRGVDLTNADLRDATLVAADLGDAKLCGADLRWADLTRAELLGADLTRAQLRGARLIGVDLSNRDFTAADFRGAILSNASFAGSNLTGALLEGARIDGVEVAGTIFNAFSNSVFVVSEAESAVLQRWVEETDATAQAQGAPKQRFCARWAPVWRGSRDGFEASEFHRRCAGRGAAFVFVQPADHPECVIGGYTSIGFRTGFQDRDARAFLFQLRPTQLRIPTKDPSLAVGCVAGSGPSFGRGLDWSHDLIVGDNAKATSSSHCKPTAAFDYGEVGGRNVLGQYESKFAVIDVEVCIMDP